MERSIIHFRVTAPYVVRTAGYHRPSCAVVVSGGHAACERREQHYTDDEREEADDKGEDTGELELRRHDVMLSLLGSWRPHIALPTGPPSTVDHLRTQTASAPDSEQRVHERLRGLYSVHL